MHARTRNRYTHTHLYFVANVVIGNFMDKRVTKSCEEGDIESKQAAVVSSMHVLYHHRDQRLLE